MQIVLIIFVLFELRSLVARIYIRHQKQLNCSKAELNLATSLCAKLFGIPEKVDSLFSCDVF